MRFLKRLFGKTTPVDSSTERQAKHPLFRLDELIATWRNINSQYDHPWVVFEHGTCVRLAEPQRDVVAQARSIMNDFGLVRPGTSAGDFDVQRHTAADGWLVSCHHSEINTFIATCELAHQTLPANENSDLAIGLFGRTRRNRDAHELEIVHIHDPTQNHSSQDAALVTARAHFVRLAQKARQARSDWTRYAIPFESVAFMSEQDLQKPPRALADIAMPNHIRQQVKAMDSVVRKAGRLDKPLTVCAGLSYQDRHNVDLVRELREAFVVGSALELRGFLSASRIPEPPLYAAGSRGAILEINVHSAVNVTAMAPRKDELEYLLPRDCRCRVDKVTDSSQYATADGRQWSRPTIQLSQL